MEAKSLPDKEEGRRRVVIAQVCPCLDCGRFAVKRIVGQTVEVTVNVFADGHDEVRAVLLVRAPGEAAWRETAMEALGNDAWRTAMALEQLGRYEFAVAGWVDPFDTWYRDLLKRIDAGQEVSLDLRIGAPLVEGAARRASAIEQTEAARLREWHRELASGAAAAASDRARLAELAAIAARYPDREHETRREPLSIVVDPPKARFSTWYELFPRSCGENGQHGTLRDVARYLPRLSEMGFDVVYLPPIHPVGTNFRKGKNNATSASAGDVGSPWAIGSSEGGHTAIHPQLGTLADLHALVAEAAGRGIDIALDIAFQCSPDHPYVSEHPQWFRRRPDGTIQYAENPPKKYQDIYPFDFETTAWQSLWRELTDVVLFWCKQGIRIFRVDNPHTKPFAFWEFLIGEVKAQYPAAIFLSEAFTRPKIMYRLAKLGFTQSYTYFTWRNTKAELTEYFTELALSDVREFFRPNLWPNTPDILPEHLQTGGRPAFVARLVLAATLGANYGIYGPAFENLAHVPREPGSEEYLNSEKYELKQWDFSRPENIGAVIAQVNRARRENPALQWDAGLVFHPTDNEQLLCYSKRSEDGANRVLVVVNLNFHGVERGTLELRLAELGLSAERPFEVQDLLQNKKFTWLGARNFVELDPARSPAHVFRISG
ncbi:MAG TPA: alpha-1,4-glucan--maltose-1-phosphate maltosyltransferase [Pirellulales bacterium]|nr:alpha-1,4-glucan--maltose-1-phosphate maltosyltransferase [Pirellulales bacterium]